MNWKSYYRDEFDLPGIRDYLDMTFSSAEEDAPLDSLINAGGILSFPHTSLHYAAMHQARVIVSLYRASVEQVIALGVLHLWRHAASSSLYRQAMSFEVEASVRQAAFSKFAGAFMPIEPSMYSPFGKISFDFALVPESSAVTRDAQGLLAEEFSLDTFFNLLQYYYLLHDRPLPRITPLYIGVTRNPLTGSFDVAEQIATAIRRVPTTKTVVVATGDVFHYGSGYSPQEVIDRMPDDPDKLRRTLRNEIEEVLTLMIDKKEYQRAFPRLDRSLNNDQRYLLPVVAGILGNRAEHNVISFELSDYSRINDVPAPCVVASSLVAYSRGPATVEKKEHEQ